MRAARIRRATFGALVVSMALAGPASANFQDLPANGKVLWMFTGAKTKTGTNGTATTVHCSNFSRTKTAILTIEFFDRGGAPVDSTGDVALGPGTQQTFSTRGTFYEEIILSSRDFEGSVRVVSSGTSRVICSAHVLSTSDAPTFATDLPRFKRSGNPFTE